MKKALFILHHSAFDQIYGEEHSRVIAKMVDLLAPPQTANSVGAHPELLRKVQVILSGWGAPLVDEAFLALAPELEAVFYGAGSLRGMVSEAFWKRGIVVSSSAAMNAIPVAEFTLAQILFSLKRGWSFVMDIRATGRFPAAREPVAGGYRSRVGVVSLGAIGRLVCSLLRPFEIELLAYDPYVDDPVFDTLGAQRATLDEIFETCDVVTLHAPNLPTTRGMLTGAHFEKMKPGATFINTSRGDIIREGEMVQVLQKRSDLWACLDVLAEADQSARALLFELPNVILTPHIAGSMDDECRRMGRAQVDELRRYLNHEPLFYQVTQERFARMA